MQFKNILCKSSKDIPSALISAGPHLQIDAVGKFASARTGNKKYIHHFPCTVFYNNAAALMCRRCRLWDKPELQMTEESARSSFISALFKIESTVIIRNSCIWHSHSWIKWHFEYRNKSESCVRKESCYGTSLFHSCRIFQEHNVYLSALWVS